LTQDQREHSFQGRLRSEVRQSQPRMFIQRTGYLCPQLGS